MTHRFELRVYYEDTDLAGIVYYANYLKFIERARSEWVRERGIDQRRLRADEGIVFAVRRIEADYLAPATFDDLLTVVTDIGRHWGAARAAAGSPARGAAPVFGFSGAGRDRRERAAGAPAGKYPPRSALIRPLGSRMHAVVLASSVHLR